MESTLGLDGLIYIATPASAEGNLTLIPNANVSQDKVSLGYIDTLNLIRGIIVLLALLLSIPGNAFIVISIATNRHMRKTLRNVLLFHLGILGLSSSVFVTPFVVFASLEGKWPGERISCSVSGFFSTAASLATMWTITSICLEKYQSIARPLHHKAKVDRNKMTVVLLAVWIVIFAISAIPFIFGDMYVYDDVSCTCRFGVEHHDPTISWISIFLVILIFYIPLLTLTVCHIRIFLIARSHHRSIAGTLRMITVSVQVPITRTQSSRRASQPMLPIGQRRAIHTTSYIMGAFIACYMPLGITNMIEIITSQSISPVWTIISATAFQISPAINALVYGIKNRNLRRALREWYHRKLVDYSHRISLPKKSKGHKQSRELAQVQQRLRGHPVSWHQNVVAPSPQLLNRSEIQERTSFRDDDSSRSITNNYDIIQVFSVQEVIFDEEIVIPVVENESHTENQVTNDFRANNEFTNLIQTQENCNDHKSHVAKGKQFTEMNTENNAAVTQVVQVETTNMETSTNQDTNHENLVLNGTTKCV